MKNYQEGFIVPLLIIVVVLAIGGGIGYVALKNKTEINDSNSVKNDVSTTTADQNNSSADIKVNVGENYLSYSNKAFAVNYPKGWTVEEFSVSTSAGSCNALGAYFVSNPVSKATLMASGKDYLHYLQNSGSVVSVKGGLGEDRSNFGTLKNILMQYDQPMKFTFSDQEMKIIDKKTDFNSKTPSVTYYYELLEYNKKGITKLMIVDGKPSPVLLRIDYVASSADYSVDVFTMMSSSLYSNLTEKSCS